MVNEDIKIKVTEDMLDSMEHQVPHTCIIKGCNEFAEYFDDNNDFMLCFNHYHDISDELQKEEENGKEK